MQEKPKHFVAAVTCWRVSAAILLILASVFITLSYVASHFQLRAREASSEAAEAWLEGGEPRWKGSFVLPTDSDTKFFLDIGSSAEVLRDSITSRRARVLEKKGWTGICSVPLPGDLGDRSCKLLVLPVAGTDREDVTVPDCNQQSALGVSELFRQLLFSTPTMCPELTLPAVGIATLLKRVHAPEVIDFISLATAASETDSILKQFPFSSYCVRGWTVRHDGASERMTTIRNILEVSHGCRLKEGSGEYFARCPCKDGGEHLSASSSAGVPKETQPLIRKEFLEKRES